MENKQMSNEDVFKYVIANTGCDEVTYHYGNPNPRLCAKKGDFIYELVIDTWWKRHRMTVTDLLNLFCKDFNEEYAKHCIM
jgi:hypothetical protein